MPHAGDRDDDRRAADHLALHELKDVVRTVTGQQEGPENERLFVSTAAPPAGTWAERGAGAQPPLDYSLEGIAFLVAPEPNGADTSDVLLCSAGIFPRRSTDGGRTWHVADQSQLLHVDTRSLAHHPPKSAYAPDTLPLGAAAPAARIYVGCDGGLGASRGYSDPLYPFDAPVTDGTYNAEATYDPSQRTIESLDHGFASIAAFQFASNPDPLAGGPMSIIGYTTALDTGTARRVGSPAWKSVGGGDAGPIFAAPAGNGVRLWIDMSANIIWPVWNLLTYVDQDPPAGAPGAVHVTTPAAPSCAATSNMLPATGADLYAGILAFEQVTTLAAPLAGGGVVVVTSAAMTPDLVVGAKVGIGDPSIDFIWFPITQVTATTFTVRVGPAGPFPIGTAVRVARSWAGSVTGAAATQISQVFIPQTRRLYRLAQHGDALLAASADQRLWTTPSASTAGATTVWSEVAGAPAGLAANIDGLSTEGGEFESGVPIQDWAPVIAGIAADASGTFYVLLSGPLGSPPTPLFSVNGGAWVAEACTQPAAAVIPINVATGAIVADPSVAGRLYVACNARVFQLDKGAAGWTWTDLSGNLPGSEIHALWIGNVAPTGAPPRTVLRATTAVRGVWEIEPGGPAITNPQLYFRDHAFDPGWLGSSTEGVVSPLNSAQRGWHWQSPDIVVDTPLRDSSSALYCQNDPEAPVPAAADFAWFKDRSQVASAGVTARVWVRVNNRNALPSATVNVWAITAPFSGALPLLPAGFWSRFHPDGTIDATLPPGSAWTSLGVTPVSGARAEAPAIAGFDLATGSAGDHRCIATFVHGPGALLDTSGLGLSIDQVVMARTQIAQRNVLVGAPLPPSASTPDPGGTTEPVAAIVELGTAIEFHNPAREAAEATIRFDLTGIPASAQLELRLGPEMRPRAVTGAERREAAIHLARGGGAVEVVGLPMKPQARIRSEIVLRFGGRREPGDVYHVDRIDPAGLAGTEVDENDELPLRSAERRRRREPRGAEQILPSRPGQHRRTERPRGVEEPDPVDSGVELARAAERHDHRERRHPAEQPGDRPRVAAVGRQGDALVGRGVEHRLRRIGRIALSIDDQLRHLCAGVALNRPRLAAVGRDEDLLPAARTEVDDVRQPGMERRAREIELRVRLRQRVGDRHPRMTVVGRMKRGRTADATDDRNDVRLIVRIDRNPQHRGLIPVLVLPGEARVRGVLRPDDDRRTERRP